MKYIYAVDIGGSSIKYGLFDETGTLMRRWKETIKDKTVPSVVMKAIASTIRAQDEVPHAVSVGVPGPVAEDRLVFAPNLGWRDVDVIGWLRAELGNSIVYALENDANLAALGESLHVTSTGTVVFFALGTGIGGGIVQAGRIVRGHHGVAGEFGHMDVGMYDFTCGCGQKGHLETIASATGLKNVARRLRDQKFPTTLTRIQSSKQIVEAAKRGDTLSTKAVDEAAKALAKAVRMVALTLNPDAVVFGGGVAEAGPFLLERVRAHYAALNTGIVAPISFVQAKHGQNAQLHGAYARVMYDD